MRLSTKGIKGSKRRTLSGQNRFCQVYTFEFIYFLIGGGPLALHPFQAHLVCWFPASGGAEAENCSRHEGLLEKHVLIDNFMWKRSKKTLKTRHGAPQIPVAQGSFTWGQAVFHGLRGRAGCWHLTGLRNRRLCPAWPDRRATERLQGYRPQ